MRPKNNPFFNEEEIQSVSEDARNILSFKNSGSNKIINSSYDIISFDIFDTIIYHKVEPFLARERAISELSVEIMCENGILTTWGELYALRRGYFELSNCETGGEVDYFQAYRYVCQNLNIQSNLIRKITEQILAAEVQYMCSVTYVNPDALWCLQKLKETSKQIIAISDMYIPQEGVIELLKYHKLINYFDLIFTSSQFIDSKHNGHIFNTILNKFHFNAKDILHMGDNFHSDVVMPELHGISALHYYNSENERRKKEIRVESFVDVTRNLPTFEQNESILSLIAHAFSLFIQKLAQECSKNKTKKIFFLTRDANFLMPHFKKYWSDNFNKDDIEIDVLALSRIQSFLLNFENESDFYERIWSLDVNPKKHSVARVLSNFEFTIFTLGYHSSFEKWWHMNYENARQDALFIETMNNFILLSKNLVIEYVLEQNIQQGQRIALVDIGYSGTSFVELSKFIETHFYNIERLDCYLFATNKYFQVNFPKINPPVYSHGNAVIDYETAPVGATHSYSWLEAITLDVSKGKLLGYEYDPQGNLTAKFDKPFKYTEEHNFVVQKVNNYIEKCLEETYIFSSEEKNLNKLYYALLHPTDQDLIQLSKLKFSYGYTNSEQRNIVRKIEKFNESKLQEFINHAQADDFWLGGCMQVTGINKDIRNYVYHKLEVQKHIR